MNLEILKIILKEFGWYLLVFLLTILISIVLLLIQTIFASLFLYESPKHSENVSGPVSFLIYLLSQNVAFLFLYFSRQKREGTTVNLWKTSGVRYSLSKKIILGIALAFTLLLAVYVQEFILSLFFDKAELEINYWSEMQFWGLAERIVLFILGAFLAPIAEELYFRETMFGSIYRKGFPNFAMFFSCAVFGIIHFNFLHIFAYLIYGVGFAMIYRETRSIIPSITAHILINSILFSIFLFI